MAPLDNQIMNASPGEKSGLSGGRLILLTGVLLFGCMLASLLILSKALQNSVQTDQFYFSLLIFNALGLLTLVILIGLKYPRPDQTNAGTRCRRPADRAHGYHVCDPVGYAGTRPLLLFPWISCTGASTAGLIYASSTRWKTPSN